MSGLGTRAGRMRISLLILTALSFAACDITSPVEEAPVELRPGFVRACLTTDSEFTVSQNCIRGGYWGNEKVPSPTSTSVPISNVAVRLCKWEYSEGCRTGDAPHYLVRTDSEGYAVFEGLPEGTYRYYSAADTIVIDGCDYVPINEYGGSLIIERLYAEHSIEFQNSHIGPLWFRSAGWEC